MAQSTLFVLYKTFIFQIIILKDKFHYKISKIGNFKKEWHKELCISSQYTGFLSCVQYRNDFLKTQF